MNAQVQTLKHEVKPITAAVLQSIAIETQTEQANAGTSRLAYFLESARETDSQTFNTALKEFRASNKKNKTMSVRASEFQAMFTSLLHGCELDGMGYVAAVNASRAFLNTKNLMPNGKPKLSDAEKQLNRDKAFARKVREEVNFTFDWNQEGAAAKFEEAYAAKADQMKADAAAKALEEKIAKADTVVKSIMEEGPEYAKAVLEALTKALAG